MKKICLGIVVVLIIYYVVCVISTHDIMKKTDEIIGGEEIITDTQSPWYSMSFKQKYNPDAVSVKGNTYRVLSFCSFNKGYIYIYYKVEYFDKDDKVVFSDKGIRKLTIERQDGEWLLVETYTQP